MIIGEIFKNPTVEKVMFEARFPNLFFLESKIGDLQIKLMKVFPISQLLHRQQLIIADFGPDGIPSNTIPNELPQTKLTDKVWRFQTDDASTTLDIQTASFSITSTKYKTYNNAQSTDKFRDILILVVKSFLEIVNIPKFNRIGLRYIDRCPFPEKTAESFQSLYDSTYPLSRFPIEATRAFDFVSVVTIGEYGLRYAESLSSIDNKNQYMLDFDGFAENLDTAQWLTITDSLYTIITTEYNKTIKEPVREIMRNSGE